MRHNWRAVLIPLLALAACLAAPWPTARLNSSSSLHLSLLLPANALAQTQERPTVDDLVCLRTVSSVSWSPAGDWIAYVVTEVDTVENGYDSDVWLVSPDGEKNLKLTNSPKSDNAPQFSPDGQWVAFLSGREERQELWLISSVAGEARRLTHRQEGVSSFCWSPDSKSIAFVTRDTLTSDEKEAREKKKFDPKLLDKETRFSHLWRVDVESGQLKRLTRGDFEVSLPAWSPDGKWVAFKFAPTPKTDDQYLKELCLVPSDSGEVRRFPEAYPDEDLIRWTPDSRQVLLCGPRDRMNFVEMSHVFLFSVETGESEELSKGLDNNCREPLPSPDGKFVYFRGQDGCDEHVYRVPIDGGEPVRLTRESGLRSSLSVSPDGRQLACLLENPRKPEDVCVIGLDRESESEYILITDVNPQVRSFSLGEVSTIRWKSTDGWGIEGILVRPVGYVQGSRYPAVVVIHGGPYSFRYANSFDSLLQLLASNGYLVLAPNFRASGGYGQKFQGRKRADWGGGDYDDIMTGVDEIVKLGLADPERLGVTGWSYGGYMTAWIVTHTDRFKAAVEGAGAVNLPSFYGQSDIKAYRKFEFTGEPWEKPEIYRKLSPLSYVKNVKTPVLLVHGELDERVPMPQAQEMYTALRALGVDVEFVTYPREGHGVREPNHRRDMLTRYVNWFDRYLK